MGKLSVLTEEERTVFQVTRSSLVLQSTPEGRAWTEKERKGKRKRIFMRLQKRLHKLFTAVLKKEENRKTPNRTVNKIYRN